MGKRSNFKRRAQDAYFTPAAGVTPLIPFLPDRPFSFDEPCAGAGDLIISLNQQSQGHYKVAMDVNPQSDIIEQGDALVDYEPRGELIITNPPWTRDILHPMIDRFRLMRPTWLLFDADWMHTVQAEPYLKYCHSIVSVGRLSWMDNGTSGKDNCAWYLFKQDEGFTTFYGRKKKK